MFKAKVPLNILGFPFQSSLSAGDSKELSLGLGTFFDSGPSFRLSYRPNDNFTPFSLLVKTGIGHFGSPINAPMTMTAEFNFLGNTSSFNNPRFFLHFKPQFGDFSIKKSHSSSIAAFSSQSNQNGGVFEEDSSLEVIEKPHVMENGDYFSVENKGSKITTLPLKSSMESALSGMLLGAKTELPIKSGAVLKLRWGVKFPEGFQTLLKNPTAKMWSTRGIPLLVLNKIGIEHVAKDDKKVGPTRSEVEGSGSADLAETCFTVKRQLETLRSENALLGKALDDLKMEFGNKGFRGRGFGGERKSIEKEVVEGDVGVVELNKV